MPLTHLHPLRSLDLPIVPVARSVVEQVARTFVEVIEGHGVFVGLETALRREVLGVPGDVGDTDFVDDAMEVMRCLILVVAHSADEEPKPLVV